MDPHRHIRVDTGCTAPTKIYVEGVHWTGLFTKEYCIPCPIGKHPQVPYTNYGNHVLKICELLQMDIFGSFLSRHYIRSPFSGVFLVTSPALVMLVFWL